MEKIKASFCKLLTYILLVSTYAESTDMEVCGFCKFECFKGQLISKCLFGVFDSSKKKPKTIRLDVP